VVRFHESLWDLVFLRLFVTADEPKDDSESQRRASQRSYYTRGGLIEIKNDESPNQSQESDQYNGPHLNDSAAMVFDYQQRVRESNPVTVIDGKAGRKLPWSAPDIQ
jgi:hypothetical protein